MELIKANNYASSFEPLPTVARTLNFSLTGRDLKTDRGGIHSSDVAVTVSGSGPFQLTAPNGGGAPITAGTAINVSWNHNGANAFCTNVNIKLSVDGGNSYPYLLAAATPIADGSENVTIPASVPNATTSRVMVECADNTCVVFFDISDADFSITSTCAAEASNICPATAMTVAAGPAANLTLAGHIGGNASGQTFTINAGDPTSSVINRTSATDPTCQVSGFTNIGYETMDFIVSTTGSYNFSNTTGGQIMYSVFEANGLNLANGCTGNTFIGANSHSSISWSTAANMNLTACTKYTMVVWELSSNGTATINISGPGAVYESKAAPAGTSYTYAAVNTANGQVAAVSNASDFSALGGGTYNVYGVNYATGVNTAAWVGQTIAQVIGADCALFSNNFKPLTIIGGATCSLTSAGLASVACNNAGTNNTTTDDYVTFSLNPTGTTLGAGYNVTVSAGTVTPTSGTYGAATNFQLQAGSAGGGNVTVTVTDNATGTCTVMATVTDPGTCSTPTCNLTSAGLSSVACNNAGTNNTGADDYITFSLNPTGTNFGTGYTVTVSAGTVTPTTGNYGAVTNFQLQAGSVGGGDVTITVTDNADGACTITASITDPGSCCPALPTPPNVTITNSTCSAGCTLSGGSITAPTGTPCPAGTTLQYSVNGGTWDTALPDYDQDGPAQSIQTRCNCDVDNTQSSTPSVAVTTVPGTCTTPATPTITITDNVCPSITGTISATGCGAGTVLEYATNAGGPWATNAPTYTTAAFTVYARCRNTTTGCVSASASSATAPTQCCPTFTAAPPNVTIVNSVCVAGGSITAPANPCPVNSTIQYSVNGGAWMYNLPTYNQAGPAQSIETRCECDADNTQVSPTSAVVTTVPGFDLTPPDLTCSIIDGINEEGDGANDCQYVVNGTEFDPGLNDNCTGVLSLVNDYTGTNTLAGAVFPVAFTWVTWTATDVSGNVSNCTDLIIITNMEEASTSCPGNQSMDDLADGVADCNYTVTGTSWDVVFGQNCGVFGTISNDYTGTNTLDGATFPLGITTVTWTTAINGQATTTCSFDVTVEDDTDPVIAGCPANIDLVTAPGSTTAVATWTPPTATDDCALASLNSTHDPGDTFTDGTTTVTYTATDDAGNTETCTFTITVTAPQQLNMDCGPWAYRNDADDSVIDCKYIVKGAELDPTLSFTAGITLTNNYTNTNTLDGASLSVGMHGVVWTATDNFGNTWTCSTVIIVSGNIGCWFPKAPDSGVEEDGTTNELFAELPELSVYPNPAKEKLTVNISGNNHQLSGKFQVFNSLGQLMIQEERLEYFPSKFDVNLNNYTNGIYMLVFEQNGQKVSRKFIVNK